MKNAVDKEEALDELGESFQNYLSILHNDESVEDSTSVAAPQENNSRMVTLDPYTVNQRIRRASVEHVSRLSSAMDKEDRKGNSHAMFWVLVALLSVAVGCSISLIIWKTTAPPSSTISDILPSSIVTSIQPSKSLIDEFNNKMDAADHSEQLENIRLPAFVEKLVDRNRKTEIRIIPLLLDIPGTGSEHLSPVLAKCLGLSSSSNFRDLETENAPNFAVTDRLCGITNKIKDGKAWLMVVMRNPVVRVVQEYLTLLNEKKTSARNVAAYVNSPTYIDNRQTRTLICKPAGEINENDFNTAKFIITNMSVLSMYQDYSNSFRHYREAFSWRSDDTTKVLATDSNQCIEDEFLKSASRTTEGLEKRLGEKDVVKNVRDKNEFDMKLYLYGLSLKR